MGERILDIYGMMKILKSEISGNLFKNTKKLLIFHKLAYID